MLPSRRQELRPELGARPGRPGGAAPAGDRRWAQSRAARSGDRHAASPSARPERCARRRAPQGAKDVGLASPVGEAASARVVVGDCVFLRSRKDRMEAFLKQMKNVSKPSDFIWALKVQGFFPAFSSCLRAVTCFLHRNKWYVCPRKRLNFFFWFCNNGNYKLPKLLWRNELSTAHFCKEKV